LHHVLIEAVQHVRVSLVIIPHSFHDKSGLRLSKPSHWLAGPKGCMLCAAAAIGGPLACGS
jgi:hypothetical protein